MNVFVYGTLKMTGRFATEFNAVRRSSKKATVNGVLYDLGFFPGANFSENGTITGEIHDLPKECITRLDGIEGFYEKDSPYNLYNRVEVNATTEDDKIVKCLSYEFNFKNRKKGNKIKSGIWKL
jgi:gamma-glutamylcyclotransferase (GGCT)/AIG2-like uncharacterized protein YtfP